jgi:hypothetical protein
MVVDDSGCRDSGGPGLQDSLLLLSPWHSVCTPGLWR